MKKIKLITIIPILFFITYFTNLKSENYLLKNEFKTISGNPFIPIDFSADGLNDFFENTYNKHWYGTEFLPNNFTHMIQFLKYGKKTKQNWSYLKSVIKVFGNKLKSTTYVNSYAFLRLLKVLPNLTKQYFIVPEINIFEGNQKVINDVLYSNFMSNFSFFKQDPQTFLQDLSKNIVKNLQQKAGVLEQHVSIENLRQSVVRFLESGLGKLVWDPKDHKKIWKLFYATAKKIERLAENNIFTDLDSLDDLFWSLIHRFCFFLELTAQELPVNFYKKFRMKLSSSDLFMFEIAEQESAMTTKEIHLVHALFENEAKARAYQSGMLLR